VASGVRCPVEIIIFIGNYNAYTKLLFTKEEKRGEWRALPCAHK
jgi:hypothetical protein